MRQRHIIPLRRAGTRLPRPYDLLLSIAELIHWFGEADLVLEATLGDTLTREELGFPAAAQEEVEEGDD